MQSATLAVLRWTGALTKMKKDEESRKIAKERSCFLDSVLVSQLKSLQVEEDEQELWTQWTQWTQNGIVESVEWEGKNERTKEVDHFEKFDISAFSPLKSINVPMIITITNLTSPDKPSAVGSYVELFRSQCYKARLVSSDGTERLPRMLQRSA